ncbi:MAG: hypothetical protein HC790_10760 [Acaryochloridaceae cyanobacterium CSU_3_4]|nr:hypothetical protein [Acaryochloridaceae cyanobacterium CSU_3_4]
MREVIGDNPNDLPIQPVWVGKALKPTRANVLNPSEINAFTPGISTFPRDPMWKKAEIRTHTETLDQLLEDYIDNDTYYEIDIKFLAELLLHTPSHSVSGYVWEDNRVQQAAPSLFKC